MTSKKRCRESDSESESSIEDSVRRRRLRRPTSTDIKPCVALRLRIQLDPTVRPQEIGLLFHHTWPRDTESVAIHFQDETTIVPGWERRVPKRKHSCGDHYHNASDSKRHRPHSKPTKSGPQLGLGREDASTTKPASHNSIDGGTKDYLFGGAGRGPGTFLFEGLPEFRVPLEAKGREFHALSHSSTDIPVPDVLYEVTYNTPIELWYKSSSSSSAAAASSPQAGVDTPAARAVRAVMSVAGWLAICCIFLSVAISLWLRAFQTAFEDITWFDDIVMAEQAYSSLPRILLFGQENTSCARPGNMAMEGPLHADYQFSEEVLKALWSLGNPPPDGDASETFTHCHVEYETTSSGVFIEDLLFLQELGGLLRGICWNQSWADSNVARLKCTALGMQTNAVYRIYGRLQRRIRGTWAQVSDLSFRSLLLAIIALRTKQEDLILGHGRASENFTAGSDWERIMSTVVPVTSVLVVDLPDLPKPPGQGVPPIRVAPGSLDGIPLDFKENWTVYMKGHERLRQREENRQKSKSRPLWGQFPSRRFPVPFYHRAPLSGPLHPDWGLTQQSNGTAQTLLDSLGRYVSTTHYWPEPAELQHVDSSRPDVMEVLLAEPPWLIVKYAAVLEGLIDSVRDLLPPNSSGKAGHAQDERRMVEEIVIPRLGCMLARAQSAQVLLMSTLKRFSRVRKRILECQGESRCWTRDREPGLLNWWKRFMSDEPHAYLQQFPDLYAIGENIHRAQLWSATELFEVKRQLRRDMQPLEWAEEAAAAYESEDDRCGTVLSRWGLQDKRTDPLGRDRICK